MSSYSRFRDWQGEGIGESIFLNASQQVESLVAKIHPRVTIQLEGRSMLEGYSVNLRRLNGGSSTILNNGPTGSCCIIHKPSWIWRSDRRLKKFPPIPACLSSPLSKRVKVKGSHLVL